MGKGGSQTIGYRYKVGMHIIDCHGPIDKYVRVEIDNKIAWEGTAISLSFDRFHATSVSTIVNGSQTIML